MNLGAKYRHGIGYIKSTKRNEFKSSEFEEKLIGGVLIHRLFICWNKDRNNIGVFKTEVHTFVFMQ